ncbi:extracellular solute-binding protein [Paenibacillus sp. FSL R7-0297]|uniref:extracellular solute-binding protein n=1 Tax=unclassified Paenibacillus TaxID=185978 RepID=UPI0004F5B32D|nr:extracellular solute-binding protein [Paenibacillus sp. FSL R5-0912]AIQ38900.1 ABC transporter substrate-binding protein [Paenibacillus sp. FSL R5-0912]
MSMKKNAALSVVLAGTVLLSACGSNNGNASSPSTTTVPPTSSESTSPAAATEGMKLEILSGNVGGKTPEGNTEFAQAISDKTGLDVTLDKPASDYDQKVLTALSSGAKYDLIEVSDLAKLNAFIDQGVVTDLTSFVQGSKILSDPAVIPSGEWEQLKGPDGKIYGVFSKFQGATMPIVRKDWLNKLGLKEPKTLDELYAVLKAFKEEDPDGNGKADTYGLSTSGLYDIQGIMSAAGLKYRYVMEDGKRTIPYATDAAIPMYEWFAKLVKEGIMDPNFITNDTAKMRNLFLTDRVGMVTYWDAWVGMFNNLKQQEDAATTFQAAGMASLQAADGTILMRRGDPDFWIIPANAPHPEAAKKFLEFWNTEDGILLGSLGVEDYDYTVDNGQYTLTDTGKEANMDHGVPYWYNSTVKPQFPALPGVEEAMALSRQYATLELSLPTWPDAEKIVTNYALKAMSGQMPAGDAVEQMQKELKAANLID